VKQRRTSDPIFGDETFEAIAVAVAAFVQ